MKIYIIRQKSSDFYKIGYTGKSVFARMRELQTGNPQRLEVMGSWEVGNLEHTRRVEALIHDFMGRYHTGGEWFCCSRDTIDHLKMLLDTKRIS